MKRYVGGVAAVLVIGLSACSGEPGSADTPSASPSAAAGEGARPTLTAPKLQPPEQEGRWVNEGRPEVVFDPCTWISDDTARAAGFDPSTRERGEDFIAEWTFLVCGFESETITLSVMSGNVSLEQETEKNGSWQRPIMVNGREATIGKEPERKDSCTVNIRTEAGVVFVDQLLKLEGRVQQTDPCMGIEETAAAVESEIGEGN